ncbi:MFS transporter [Luteimonas sp. BDR2-5]|uniref:MFS transporter n=1 Tax=Proluteimonas luteida TaxID=2878685 RepID=UPI001E358BDE|nr:MFS transporter [Luteimonas sp. BDR2-5]MCD9028711.1 MFS transporter [Luteimonas sp. BDR2-5]
MSRFQWTAIAICVLLNVLDGFDVMVMAFTASHVADEWGLSGSEIGLTLSAGLFGMAGGSLFLAPLADRYGRRAIILASMAIITAGMFASAFAQNVGQLAALRVVTGLGIGGMLASVGVIAAEYSSDRYRSLSLALYSIGYPIGATIGGILAVWLIQWWGWRSVFAGGALASLLVVPLVLRYLPESLDFLVTRRPAGALPRLNRLLARMHLPQRDALPDPVLVAAGARTGYAKLFSPALLRTTVLIALAFFMLMFGTYFVLSWTPKLLVDAGMSSGQGITGGVLLNLGGIAGGGLFGWLTTRFPLRALIAIFLAGTASALALFGYVSSDLAPAFAAAVLIGFALFGSMAGLYALAPIVYDASVRTTGLGWAIGVGRIGAILAPAIVGVLVDAGWRTGSLYYLFSVPLLVAAVAVLAMRRGHRSATA